MMNARNRRTGADFAGRRRWYKRAGMSDKLTAGVEHPLIASIFSTNSHPSSAEDGHPRVPVSRFLLSLLRPRLGAFLCGLLLVLLNRVASLVTPLSTRFVVDDIVGRHNAHLLLPLVAVIVVAILVQALASFCATQLISKGAQRALSDLRIDVQRHLLLLPVHYFDRSSSGTLTSRITSDIDGIRTVVGAGLVELLGSAATSCLALVLLFNINTELSLVTVSFLAVFLWCVIVRFRLTKPLFKERSKRLGHLAGRLTEAIAGIRVVKGFTAEESESLEFTARARSLLAIIVRIISTDSAMAAASTATTSLVGAILLYIGIGLVLSHRLSLGAYLTYQFLLAYVLWPVNSIVTIGAQLSEAFAGIERTLDILSEPKEQAGEHAKLSVPSIRGEIHFQDVTFSYCKGQPVLHQISFTVHPGRSVALVGASGAGKSTIANLVCAFYKPDSGLITIDGMNLSALALEEYRRQLGVVFQDCFLFEGTIRENITFASLGYSEGDLRRVCRQACVEEFVERLPDGYETTIGERGVRLSGGQKQRITIARALLSNPRILVLDEATSNVDSESEQLIQQALRALMANCTTVVIAHRLSTIRLVDEIIVLEKGRIIEQGKHSVLYDRGERYRDLCDNQLVF